MVTHPTQLLQGLSIGLNIAAEGIKYVTDIAEMADRSDIEYLWMVDSQLRFREPFIALTAAALKTSKIKLGTSVTNPLTRHYTVLACSIASLDELSNSRAILGIGSGHSAVYMIGMRPTSLKHLKQSVLDIRSLLRGDTIEDSGYKISLYTKRNVPIYLGASGPKSLKLSGQIADGVFLQVGARPGIFRHAVKTVQDAAKKAGRNASKIDLAGYVVCSISDNKDKAINSVKFMVSSILGFASSTILNLPEDSTGLNNREKVKIKGSIDHAKLKLTGEVSDQIAEKLTVAGRPSYVAERLGELSKSGISQICLNMQPPEERLSQLRVLIKDVLPSL
jgi:5,10-methylenetetrahydromethanopterin reductase